MHFGIIIQAHSEPPPRLNHLLAQSKFTFSRVSCLAGAWLARNDPLPADPENERDQQHNKNVYQTICVPPQQPRYPSLPSFI